jgi:hypothetical protein
MESRHDAGDGEPKPAQDTTQARRPQRGIAVARPAEAEPTPTKIRITHQHAFLDENKRVRSWKAGDVVTDAAEIEMLMERKAPLVKLE